MRFKFFNELELDFTNDQNEEQVVAAVKKVKALLGEEIPMIINGKRIRTQEWINSYNPAEKSQLVAKVASATATNADEAVEACAAGFEKWKKVSLEERLTLAQRVVELLLEKRFELIAWMSFENGKNWGEADGEICELIDFTRAYMNSMEKLSEGLDYLIPDPQEERACVYVPIGVGIAVAPWNFPLSLIGGMVMSALITGNTVVLKPASDTPAVAYRFFEILEEAGYPADSIAFLPGSGAAIGNQLVAHPQTRFVNFTGSKEVGLKINELAAKTGPGQIWIKRVVAEMGGKNAIVVDESADLAKAASDIVASAFFLQGQKCSACSRVIVHETIKEQLVEMIVQKTQELEQGAGTENYALGPVISQSAFNKITKYIEIAKKEDQLIYGGSYDDQKGYFIDPAIFAVSPESTIFKEEIFGPVLAITGYQNFSEAISLANATEYALTGSLYSENEANIKEAQADFHVGNLYINHKSTGAVVRQHPFGGFNMSGTDAKTGTHDYLQNFLQLKSITRTITK
ncbi:L-glutamate gamma-semialdehyde dehydrogenase [Enterococcus sp. AZ196]|uniref:L-glutamate gamma-semialdehyde dehydrogenase n=1 Tax=Enterococcus sp. AZ196 TaxID=2774659 RepID=UPI003D26FDBA